MKRTLCTMKTKLIILLLASTLTAGAQMYFGTKKEVPDSVLTHWHKLRLWDGTAGTNSDAM